MTQEGMQMRTEKHASLLCPPTQSMHDSDNKTYAPVPVNWYRLQSAGVIDHQQL